MLKEIANAFELRQVNATWPDKCLITACYDEPVLYSLVYVRTMLFSRLKGVADIVLFEIQFELGHLWHKHFSEETLLQQDLKSDHSKSWNI